MTRREFLRTAGLAAGGLAWRPLRGAAAGSARKRLNLVIIHTDEHNFRTLGCYRKLMAPEQAFVWGRQAVVKTPHIDSLARRGAICTSFYATTPVCSPSRGAFVSGRYPQNTPVTTNNIPMSDDVVTFAEILRRAGYATGYAGKWHLDGTGKPQWAPKRRFGFADNRCMFNRGHYKQLEQTPGGPRVKARTAAGKPTYSVAGANETSFTTDFLADRAVEFIRDHKDEPFCFMLSIPDPHGPNTVRPPYDTMFQDMTFQPPRTMGKGPAATPKWAPKQADRLVARQMALYFGMVKCVDDNVGKVLAALRAAGVMERTIVLFTSDHGDLCGEHGRHNKGVPYEASAKIPFVIACPGRIAPGTVVREALSCVDFLPTILKLMGAATAGKEEGRDASALLTAGKAPAGWKDIAFLRSTGRPGAATAGWLAAVTRRYKLVLSAHDEPWLFDLETDPDELTNGFARAENREVIRGLARELIAYGRAHKDPYVEQPAVKSDLAWCADGTGPYVPPPRAARPPRGRGNRAARRRRATG